MSLCRRIHWFTMIWDSLEWLRWLRTIHDRMRVCGWSRKQNHLGQISYVRGVSAQDFHTFTIHLPYISHTNKKHPLQRSIVQAWICSTLIFTWPPGTLAQDFDIYFASSLGNKDARCRQIELISLISLKVDQTYQFWVDDHRPSWTNDLFLPPFEEIPDEGSPSKSKDILRDTLQIRPKWTFLLRFNVGKTMS